MDELKLRLEQKRRPIYNFVNGLFDILPPEPNLYIGETHPLGNVVGLVPTRVGGIVPSWYLPDEKEIVILTPKLRELSRKARREMLNISPRYHGERVLTKEYAHHCYAFMQGFKIDEQMTDLYRASLQEPVDFLEWFVKMALPSAKIEGVGYFAFLRVAVEFGHRDDYLTYFDRQKGRSKEVAQNILRDKEGFIFIRTPDERIVLTSLQPIAVALSRWFAESWMNMSDEEVKELMCHSINFLDQEEILKAKTYLMS